MKLELHTAGNGAATAILVHGLVADHGTWHAIEPGLVNRGYRVLAPDLRGHGRSSRAASYRLAEFADDPAETLPVGAATELRRRGFEVAAVANTGHCIHRDDPVGFLAALAGWI